MEDFTKFKRGIIIALVIIALGCAYGIYQARTTATDAEDAAAIAAAAAENTDQALVELKAEGRKRRDQQCVLFERSHLKDVQDLRATYKYLAKIKPPEAASTINQTIARGLPEQEEQARTDTAPGYCDAKGIGLPEPDPQLPPKRDFSYLLNQGQQK